MTANLSMHHKVIITQLDTATLLHHFEMDEDED